MIRVYLDWNVISNLKKPEFKALDDFILLHKERLLFPYSPAHFKDLMKSFSPENTKFETDLKKLQEICGKHYLGWRDNQVVPLFGTPQEYFENSKDQPENSYLDEFDFEKHVSDLDDLGKDLGLDNAGTMIKDLLQNQISGINLTEESKGLLNKMFPNLNNDSSLWDFVKDYGSFTKSLMQSGSYYRDFRKNLGEYGFKVDANSGNWNEDEVIQNIDIFLKSINTSFREYVDTILKSQQDKYSYYDFFTTAYLVLDMIGYKSDKLPKSTDNIQNIQVDADHAFYGAHCDYFIGMDKKLLLKSKVLYSEFKLPIKVLTPDQFIGEINAVIHLEDDKKHLIDNIFEFYKKEKIVESWPPVEESEPVVEAVKLDKYLFDFFNYAVYSYYQSEEIMIITGCISILRSLH